MKRTLTMAITVLLVVAMLVGCGQTGPNVNPSNSATPSTSTNPSGSEKPSANDYWGPEPALEADPTPVAVDELPTTGIGTQISTDIKANSKYKIAIIVKNTTNPFLLKSIAGTQKQLKIWVLNVFLYLLQDKIVLKIKSKLLKTQFSRA